MYNEEFTEANANTERDLSVEDRRALKIMDQSATLVNGHYQLKLPFRETLLTSQTVWQSPKRD